MRSSRRHSRQGNVHGSTLRRQLDPSRVQQTRKCTRALALHGRTRTPTRTTGNGKGETEIETGNGDRGEMVITQIGIDLEGTAGATRGNGTAAIITTTTVTATTTTTSTSTTEIGKEKEQKETKNEGSGAGRGLGGGRNIDRRGLLEGEAMRGRMREMGEMAKLRRKGIERSMRINAFRLRRRGGRRGSEAWSVTS